MNSILAVGSVAFDSIKTPSGEVSRVVGGSAAYFSIAASFFAHVRVVAIVGDDFGEEEMKVFSGRQIDLAGLQKMPGETFRWKGEYGFDLNNRETLYTHLNVFENFQPVIPRDYQGTPFVFLGNIHPSLQLEVLDQVSKPSLVAADTMNYWIERTPDELRTVLKRVNALIINDAELRQLSGESNLVKAARLVKAMGPKLLVIKRGEHGVIMVRPNGFFAVPGIPLESVVDPTGAGDTFAGAFMGYLASHETVSDETLAQAVVAGSTLASFSVEDFSLDRLLRLTHEEVAARLKEFKHLTQFEELE